MQDETSLNRILEFVQRHRGLDLRLYRRATIERRVNGRMRLANVASLDEYLNRLESEPEEVDRLLAYVTIKVSQFFRNAEVFGLLRRVALPKLAHRKGGQPLRVWSAGCGHGEEAYSLAILVSEVEREFGLSGSVVYATDVDQRALAVAEEAVYQPQMLSDIPPDLLAAHFIAEERARGGMVYRVGPGLRSLVRFLRHDLCSASGPPEGLSFDLVCCRNVLIYFDQATQRRAQELLCASLAAGGYLCLGEAEHLTQAVEACLDVIDRRGRLYRIREGR